jgi:hypothetical protein
MTSVSVAITVGGIPAQRLYAGRQSASAGDNIYLTVPQGVPYGCNIPVRDRGRRSASQHGHNRRHTRCLAVPVNLHTSR